MVDTVVNAVVVDTLGLDHRAGANRASGTTATIDDRANDDAGRACGRLPACGHGAAA
jgi:hypothetical protein